jgi:peptidoglycan hydrolase CwlO-like protein
MAVPEGSPQTPENSARNEAIPTALGRRQNHPAETLRAPVVEFPSLDDGKRITYQTVASLISSLKKVITQQTNIIELARAEIHEIKTEQNTLREQNTKLQEEIQALRTKIENQATTILPPKPWAEVASTISPPTININPRP